MAINEIDRLLTVREVALMLHIHSNTLRRWSDTGMIKSLRISARGDRRYRHEDIVSFIDQFQAYKNNDTQNRGKTIQH
jgi:DNA-binding transcriptional MerR regulator